MGKTLSNREKFVALKKALGVELEELDEQVGAISEQIDELQEKQNELIEKRDELDNILNGYD